MFQLVIPENAFLANPNLQVAFGILKIRSKYMFSQRRTNINDLVDNAVREIRANEQLRLA